MKPHLLLLAVAALGISSCEKNNDTGSKQIDLKTDQGSEAAEVSQHEELAGEIMVAMKDLADTLMEVSDVTTAKAAADKINEIGDRFEGISARLAPLDPPADEIRARIHEEMEERDAETQCAMGEDLEKKMQKLSPEATAIVQESLSAFFQKMDNAGKEFERHFEPKTDAN